uniref:Putative ovule protein n=1 Tax=Solanum chacoense TaxID=4108 RepID=A0A0V0GU62_SOLCH
MMLMTLVLKQAVGKKNLCRRKITLSHRNRDPRLPKFPLRAHWHLKSIHLTRCNMYRSMNQIFKAMMLHLFHP